MTPSATAKDVTVPGRRPDGQPSLVWRTAPSDEHQARVLGELVRDQIDPERVALVYRNDTYGNGLRTGFLETACGDGGDCPFTLEPRALPEEARRAEQDVDPMVELVAALKEAEPDLVVLFPFRGEGLHFLKLASAEDWSPPVLTSDTMLSPRALEEEAMAGYRGWILGTSPGTVEGPDYRDFATRYDGENPGKTPDSFTAHAYDAAMLVGLAAVFVPPAEPITGVALADGLKRLSGTGEAHIVKPSDLSGAIGILTELTSGELANYEGASGHLNFDPTTGQADAEPRVVIVDAGALTVLDEFLVDADCSADRLGPARSCPE